MKRRNNNYPKGILFVENTADLVGGGQQSLLGLLKFLDRERYAPKVVFPDQGPLSDQVQSLGVPVFFNQMGTLKTLNLPKVLGSIWRLMGIIRNEGIDIVHTNASRTTLYAGLASRMCGVALVWHVRIAMQESFYDRILYHLAGKVIAISHAVAARFPYKDRHQRVSVIYNGIDLDAFFMVDASQFRKRFQLENKFVIGQVGQIHPLKGQEYLILALKELSKSFPQIHCLIVGTPTEYQKELEEMVHRLRMDSYVSFTGWQGDIREVMSALDILVVPSHTEGFGRVLIEGMACERPIVAFSVDAIPEVIASGETGLLVEKGDVHGLVSSMHTLITDKALRMKLAKQGNESVRRRYNIKENVRKTQEVYELCSM